MHRVSSTGNASGASRARKERRFTYVLHGSDDAKHCSGVNALQAVEPTTESSGGAAAYGSCLFTGSRDGTVKRWDTGREQASCAATYESHTDWVNDIALVKDSLLVSCSSDASIKVWQAYGEGQCVDTLRKHGDYVTCLAASSQTSVLASAGLGCELYLWDVARAMAPLSCTLDSHAAADEPLSVPAPPPPPPAAAAAAAGGHSRTPVAVKGHKESVYALAMNDAATVIVSGGTEKAVRVWDARSGQKQMKLRGHTDNVRALLLDSSGRWCLSGSSDSIIRLWDLGQQRCVHSYAVHTDSVWALAADPAAFHRVYSGGRDGCVYMTDLHTRDSVLLVAERSPVTRLALAMQQQQQQPSLWVATTASKVRRWPATTAECPRQLVRGSSLVAGALGLQRARASLSLDGVPPPAPVALHKEALEEIGGHPAIVQHAVLNDRRHVLSKDSEGRVQLWEITRGACVRDYGMVSFEDVEKGLFEKVSVPSWFSVDVRLGMLSIHLETPQCFSAEMYAADLQMKGLSEEFKINIGQETLKGVLHHWQQQQQPHSKEHEVPNGGPPHTAATVSPEGASATNGPADDNAELPAAFDFSRSCTPSIMTEGSEGGPWRRKASELDGSEDARQLPWWCIDCVLHNQLPSQNPAKCSFFLEPAAESGLQPLAQGKLSAPRILRIHKVASYVTERLSSPDASPSDPPQAGAGGSIEIICNDEVLSPDMSLATVKAYIWKKSDDLALSYRTARPQQQQQQQR
eukprot:jgi/Mesen1/2754/ME000017S02121